MPSHQEGGSPLSRPRRGPLCGCSEKRRVGCDLNAAEGVVQEYVPGLDASLKRCGLPRFCEASLTEVNFGRLQSSSISFYARQAARVSLSTKIMPLSSAINKKILRQGFFFHFPLPLQTPRLPAQAMERAELEIHRYIYSSSLVDGMTFARPTLDGTSLTIGRIGNVCCRAGQKCGTPPK